jgi:hypothetical protein
VVGLEGIRSCGQLVWADRNVLLYCIAGTRAYGGTDINLYCYGKGKKGRDGKEGTGTSRCSLLLEGDVWVCIKTRTRYFNAMYSSTSISCTQSALSTLRSRSCYALFNHARTVGCEPLLRKTTTLLDRTQDRRIHELHGCHKADQPRRSSSLRVESNLNRSVTGKETTGPSPSQISDASRSLLPILTNKQQALSSRQRAFPISYLASSRKLNSCR